MRFSLTALLSTLTHLTHHGQPVLPQSKPRTIRATPVTTGSALYAPNKGHRHYRTEQRRSAKLHAIAIRG